jgi:exonuclease SbcC
MYSEFESSCDEIVSIEAEISELENDSKASDEKIAKFDKDYRELIKQRDVKSDEIKGIINQSNKSILEISNLCNEARNEIAALNKRSREIQNILSGVITCPKCSHKFLLDDNADIDGITVEKKLNFENVAIKSDEIVKLEANADVERGAIKSLRQQEASLMDIGKDVAALGRNEAEKQNKILSSISKLKKSLSIISSTRDAFENKISKLVTDAFDETEDEIAQMIKVAEKNKMAIEKDLNSIEMRIEQIEFAIEALEKFDPDSTLPELKKRLEQYNIEMSAFDKRMIQIQAEIDKFAMQENVFNEFKTHLANSKIDALSEVTNSFLDLIGSDLRVEFQGFKLLKSGKIRDKITVQLLRNGIEVGSFGKLSVGESARINLACILAMNKLINVNCDDNKGLDLLVLDEILEGIDEAGLVSVLSALNSIGITAIVVSQLAVAESNDNVLIVTKENGESRID